MSATARPLSEVFDEQGPEIDQKIVQCYGDYVEALVAKENVTAEEKEFVTDFMVAIKALVKDYKKQKQKIS